MMPNKPVPNAKDLLPRGLLSRLRRHASGLIYIPAPQTQTQMNIARVRSLNIRGHEPARIAQLVGLSTKHVRDIIRRLEDGDSHGARDEYKVYETVPHEIVELVQRYASGPIYVPPKVSQAARRRSIVQRLLRKGVPVSEIAQRTGVSERRVWQIRKEQLEAAQSEPSASKPRAKTREHIPQDPFALGDTAEPGYNTPPRLCSTCGTPVSPGERDCDICRYKAETKRNADSDVIVISSFPSAIIDRKF